ncbi:hypothetical protein PENSPDRAFT_747104 [Peniophora sp. CONT]|nr:hypothetical protein PENSPDRAFT_747104 [Peniophora sp. CONT]
MVSHKDYSREMGDAYPDYGFAVANPQPGLVDTVLGESRPRVELGDVGYIHRNQGNFIQLFNINKVPGEAGQPRPERLPVGFMPLEAQFGSRHNDNITEDTTQLFKTESVTIKGGEGGIHGPALLGALSVGGSINFTSTKQGGAVLVTPGPRPITRIDATLNDIRRYKEYAAANMDNWLSFFESENVEPTSVFLVTGVDRTASWATAASTASKHEIEFSISVEIQSVGGFDVAPKLSWKRSPTMMANSSQMPRNGHVQEPLTDNHTIFMRRLRIKRRTIIPGFKMKAAAGSHELDTSKDQDPEEASTVSYEMAESPEPEEFVDALTPILEFILERSDARIAIAHDQDLPFFNRLTKDEKQMQDPSRLIQVSDHGVGSLLVSEPSTTIRAPEGAVAETYVAEEIPLVRPSSGKEVLGFVIAVFLAFVALRIMSITPPSLV